LGSWFADWMWGLPLLLVTVLIHVFGLLVIRDKVVGLLERAVRRREFRVVFALTATVLLITALHAVEAAAWSVLYLWLGALPDGKSAMLYSLGAMTAFGHSNLYLEPHWQMMGVVEALNGLVLFGLTTAVLFSIVESVSGIAGGRRRGE
jgi:hypothetical protein